MPADSPPPLQRRDTSSFSLTDGGPFHRLQLRLHLRTAEGRTHYAWLGFLVWLPIAVAAVVQHVLGMPRDPIAFDISVHVRLLVALPVMLYGERLLGQTSRIAIESLYTGEFCDRGHIDQVVERAEHLRDSRKAELVLLALAVFGGQLALWQVLDPVGWIHGGSDAAFWSFPRWWYSLVALPLYQFVLLRFIWHWAIWSYVLARFARMPLVLLATHPDRAAGLGTLVRPTAGFAALAFASSAVLAGAWATQLRAGATTPEALVPFLVADVIIVLIVALAPLLPLSPHLIRARAHTLAEYGDFARRYVLDFHARWIATTGNGQQALGSSDIQSLADLGNSFQSADATRVVVFGPRAIVLLAIATALPCLPVFASALTVEELLRRLATTAFGALPG